MSFFCSKQSKGHLSYSGKRQSPGLGVAHKALCDLAPTASHPILSAPATAPIQWQQVQLPVFTHTFPLLATLPLLLSLHRLPPHCVLEHRHLKWPPGRLWEHSSCAFSTTFVPTYPSVLFPSLFCFCACPRSFFNGASLRAHTLLVLHQCTWRD